MTVKTLNQPSDISEQYNGEIFVKASSLASFNTIKSFIDENNLICFIESENKIYAQGHEYSGITSAQATAIANIANLETSIQNITDKLALTNDNKSIIGNLTYTIDNDGTPQQVQATNVTSFVNAVVAAVQSGSYDITSQLNEINSAINDINTLLNGFPTQNAGQDETVKEYVDRQLTSIVNQLSLAIAANATVVVSDPNDPHIKVSYQATVDQTDPVTGEVISYKAPYTFKVEGTDIASASSLSELTTKINTLFGNTNNKSIQQIIDEELADKLIPDNAKESLDTLQEIADWIQSHPDSVASINSALSALRNDLDDLSDDWNDSKDGFALKGELYEPDGEGGERLKTTENGQTYATTLEEVNELIGHMSMASDVEDGAEQNVINAIDVNGQKFNLNGTDITFDIGDNQTSDTVEFIGAAYNSQNRTISLDINTDAFEQIASLVISTSVNTAVQNANTYTDQKLSWIIA